MAGTGPADGIFSRLSARSGNTVALNATFNNNGVPNDPFALRRVDIYKGSVKEENLVAQVLFGTPDGTGYPYPAIVDPARPGVFEVLFEVPIDFKEGIYFDVWKFVGNTPESLSDFDYDDEDQWICQCNKFWVFCDGWFLDDGLLTPRFAFEPLDSRFRKGEVRSLEVGIMPLPLYDWDMNRFGPMIPQICPFITVETMECEILEGLEKAPCKLGLRQGTYRSNPYVVQCPLDTSSFLKGKYRYKITMELPNGESRVSEYFTFSIT
tara:strand:+ start:19497 stop:20294 length:798 start_codon:yes stop_codon:yes gene_type:complete